MKRVEKNLAVGVFKNGRLFRAWILGGPTKEVVFSDKPKPGQKTYYRVELIGKPNLPFLKRLLLYGRVISMSNPIYFGY
ncbi:MAG: hypothetical protein A3K03_00150 [Bdellovibrionales bacterium RIFOXYD1_FULL_44_7]|nr:MAG: hypothetical protein A3K03_00150 [Bdellovibrionales bacterium RIFOXYD1_FULL_44_7]